MVVTTATPVLYQIGMGTTYVGRYRVTGVVSSSLTWNVIEGQFL